MVLCKKYDYPHKKLPRVLLWRNFKKKSRSVAIYVVFVFFLIVMGGGVDINISLWLDVCKTFSL